MKMENKALAAALVAAIPVAVAINSMMPTPADRIAAEPKSTLEILPPNAPTKPVAGAPRPTPTPKPSVPRKPTQHLDGLSTSFTIDAPPQTNETWIHHDPNTGKTTWTRSAWNPKTVSMRCDTDGTFWEMGDREDKRDMFCRTDFDSNGQVSRVRVWITAEALDEPNDFLSHELNVEG